MKRRLTSSERKKFINLRRSFKSPVIGVTGNYGKTTTLAMINAVLSKYGRVLRSKKGVGNWKYNLETLEKLSPDYDFALFEYDFVRGNNFGEILRLIKPNIGIVTNFGDAHLSYLGNMIDIALQKSEVVKYLARDGTAILNRDDDLCSSLSEYISVKKIIRFGLSHNADYYATDVEHHGPEGTRFKVNGKHELTLPLFSLMDIYNFLAALGALVSLDFPLKQVLEDFEENLVIPDGRGKLHSVNGFHFIDESYSATPRTVAKATRALVGFKPYVKDLVFIVGDMAESGPNIEEQHLNMGYFISALPIDHLITVGPYAQFIGKGVSLIQSKGKTVNNCNTIDDILTTLDKVLKNKAAIAVQGIGQVGMRRLLKHFGKRS